MKVVILAGGFGSRLSEETELKPKPMVEIGDKPILWHIMKIYSHYGFNDFVICLGFKGFYIKEYFSNYYLHNCNVTFDFRKNGNNMIIDNHNAEPWRVALVDTGLNTMTGGRIKRIQEYIGDETFMMTYGDGVSNVNITKLVEFHKEHKKLVTVTAVKPSGRFGALEIQDSTNRVKQFKEKPKEAISWMNGGFFVIEPQVFDYIQDDEMPFELEPLENISRDNQLVAYKHDGFWRCMDTFMNKKELNKLWVTNPEWKLWD